MKTTKCMLWLLGGILFGSIAGCAPLQQPKSISVASVETLTPDTTSNIQIKTIIQIPEKSFSRRSRLIIQPLLIQEDSIVEHFSPVVLDAPIWAKKIDRAERFSGQSDSLTPFARRVNPTHFIQIPYTASTSVPQNGKGGQVVAILSTYGCGACEIIDTVEMARISDVTSLLNPTQSFRLIWIEPQFVIRPKIVKGDGEALLRFPINRHNIDPALGKNREELTKMLSALQKIMEDSLASLANLTIEGMASADGPYDYNVVLARRRANAAKEWLIARLNLSPAQASLIQTGSRPEGWNPVLEAMKSDGHPDTLLLESILNRCAGENDDVAEHYIRKLSCWPEIRNRYLQKDRKVKYEYTCTIKSFSSDEEIRLMYDKRSETLNEEEMMRVTALQPTLETKIEVYKTMLHYFPQSSVAANNLAILLLQQKHPDEAWEIIAPLPNASPELLNTKAAILVQKNDHRKALEILKTIDSLPEARYNLGLLLGANGCHEAAYMLLKEFETTDAALTALATNRNTEAASIMAINDDTSPRAEYVRALIAARQGNVPALLKHLSHAVSEECFLNRALSEADFIPYANRQDFIARIKEK